MSRPQIATCVYRPIGRSDSRQPRTESGMPRTLERDIHADAAGESSTASREAPLADIDDGVPRRNEPLPLRSSRHPVLRPRWS